VQGQNELRRTIRRYRKNLRISQQELAVLARVSRPTIANFELGHSNLSSDSMERVRAALLALVKERAIAAGFLPAPELPIESGPLIAEQCDRESKCHPSDVRYAQF